MTEPSPLISGAERGRREYLPGTDLSQRQTDKYAVCVAYWGQLDIEHNDCMAPLKDRFDRYRSLGCPYVDLARALLCRITEDYAGVFFIDHDILFDAADVDRVIEAAEQQQTIVSGVYAERKVGGLRLVGAFREELTEVEFFKDGGLYPGYYAGLGFTAIPRRVLEAVGKDMPRVRVPATLHSNVDWVKPLFAHDLSEGWYSGEDISFYKRAERAGFPVVLDTRPRLYHVGRYRYGVEDAQIVVPRADSVKLILRSPHAPPAPTIDASEHPINQVDSPELAKHLDAEDALRARQLEPLPAEEPSAPVRRGELGAGCWAVTVPDAARGAWYDWLHTVGDRVFTNGSAPGDVVIITVGEAVPFGLELDVLQAVPNVQAPARAEQLEQSSELQVLAAGAVYRVRVLDELGFANWVSEQKPDAIIGLDTVELPNDQGDGWLVKTNLPLKLERRIGEASIVVDDAPSDATPATSTTVAEAMIAASETQPSAVPVDPETGIADQPLEREWQEGERAAVLEQPPLELEPAPGRPIEAAEPPPLPGFKGVFDAPDPLPESYAVEAPTLDQVADAG